MKKTIIIACLLFTVSVFSVQLNAQEESTVNHQKAPWVSDRGYWVIETSGTSPRDHQVWFYTNNNELIYHESLTNVSLNPDKKKVKMRMKKLLEASVTAFERTRRAEQDGALVRTAF